MTNYVMKMINAYNNKEVTYKDAINLIKNYYKENNMILSLKKDIIFFRIAILIHNDKSFKLDPSYLKFVHYFIFNSIIDNAGEYRKKNISKKEECLYARTVIYSPYDLIIDNLSYDFQQERNNIYRKKSVDEITSKLSIFISHIWQAHPFSDGNTRTDAIFLQKYLEFLNIDYDNHIFDANFNYFRNALARSNYTTIKGLEPTYEYLNTFIYNLIKGNTEKLNINETFVPEEKMLIKRP